MHRSLVVARAFAFALVLAPALASLASAHLEHDLPHLQGREENRRVETTKNGTLVTVDLVLNSDPLVNLVRHRVDLAHGIFETEFRRDDSDAQGAFRTRITIVRIIEYRDQNADLHFENDSDAIVRSWRFDAYNWETAPWHAVFIGGQQAQDTAWAGNVSGAPDVKFELGAAGLAFTDEGAKVRQQDVIVYADMKGFPPRGVGDLYAIEGTIRTTQGGAPSIHRLTDANGTSLPVALLATTPDRLAFLDWGGQATLDKVEQNLNVTLSSKVDAAGDRGFIIDLPRFDKTVHMVMVSGVEYLLPDRRSPDVALPLGVGAVLILALLSPLRGGRRK